jgi:hypothetical protein
MILEVVRDPHPPVATRRVPPSPASGRGAETAIAGSSS